MKTCLLWAAALIVLMQTSCAVMSRPLMDEALPKTDFNELARNVDRYIGETVVLGGYVLDVENHADHTRMMVLQTPLGVGQKPHPKDRSQGRLILLYDGFLDAEVFTRDRRVTVGGRILEPRPDGSPPYAHLRVQVREIHLWPVEAETYDPYWHDHWYYHGPWRWHRPWWPHRHWHRW